MPRPPIYVPEDAKKSRGLSFLHPLHNIIDMARTRLLVVVAVFIMAFSVIGLQLFNICILCGGDEGTPLASKLTAGRSKVRSDIVDRNGELLATSLRTSSLYANAKVVIDPMAAAEKLVTVLTDLNPADVEAKLSSGKSFVWLARHLTPQLQADIIKLGIPGLYFQKDERRVYPHGHLFSHMIGFTDIDNNGIAGIERKFDGMLQIGSKPLELSVDLRVQHILRDSLRAGIKKFNAQGGAGIVMNLQTGEIIAMASLPDFDPHRIKDYKDQPKALFNRTTLGIYEMGSSFKIINTALALDKKVARMKDSFDVTQPLRIGRFKITDYHPSDHWMNVAEIFITSSNIGSAKLALKAGADLQKAFFKSIGLFDPVKLEVPELGSPLLPREWSKVTTITASYGYGISVSPLQLVRAVGGIVNKGVMVQPTLLKRSSSDVDGVRVVSEKTSEAMRKLLYMVVAEGTGRKANVKGYEVGGKTGTANQTKNGSYKKGQNNTSFVAAFPMRDPQYIVFIMVDRPQGIKETYGFNAGGWNAAPIAGDVIRKAAPLLGVKPVGETDTPRGSPMMLNISMHRH